MKQNISSIKKNIVTVGRRMYDRGYVASNDGNISARLDARRVLITPTGVSKGHMSTADLIVVDMNGNVVRGRKKPSSEIFLHLRIYRERPDVNSVCHSHPPYATAFAVAGIPLDRNVLPEVVISLGAVPVIPYGTTGTEDFIRPLLPYLGGFDAFLLANHGALTVGSDVLSAYHKMETVEHCAIITFIAGQLGKVNELTDDQVRELKSMRGRYGIRTDVGTPPGGRK